MSGGGSSSNSLGTLIGMLLGNQLQKKEDQDYYNERATSSYTKGGYDKDGNPIQQGQPGQGNIQLSPNNNGNMSFANMLGGNNSFMPQQATPNAPADFELNPNVNFQNATQQPTQNMPSLVNSIDPNTFALKQPATQQQAPISQPQTAMDDEAPTKSKIMYKQQGDMYREMAKLSRKGGFFGRGLSQEHANDLRNEYNTAIDEEWGKQKNQFMSSQMDKLDKVMTGEKDPERRNQLIFQRLTKLDNLGLGKIDMGAAMKVYGAPDYQYTTKVDEQGIKHLIGINKTNPSKDPIYIANLGGMDSYQQASIGLQQEKNAIAREGLSIKAAAASAKGGTTPLLLTDPKKRTEAGEAYKEALGRIAQLPTQDERNNALAREGRNIAVLGEQAGMGMIQNDMLSARFGGRAVDVSNGQPQLVDTDSWNPQSQQEQTQPKTFSNALLEYLADPKVQETLMMLP